MNTLIQELQVLTFFTLLAVHLKVITAMLDITHVVAVRKKIVDVFLILLQP